ncbi:MAG: ABC transporter substrate-binding protein [Chloroflexi bacterium]|nr:ABC transporter substrate-binding protein [Chloroflexota bacterium]
MSRSLLAASVLLTAVTMLAACAPSAPTTPAAPPGGTEQPSRAPGSQASRPPGELRTLQNGYIALQAYYYPLWIASQYGFLENVGLRAEWTQLGTNESISALLGGSVEILAGTTDAAITAISKGANLKVLANYHIVTPYDLVGRPEIASVQDLRGKKVGASSLKSGSGTIARFMLLQHGLRDTDYELTQVGGNTQRYAALQSGGISATLLSDPVNFQARLDGFRILQTFADVLPEYSLNVWMIRGDWADSPRNQEDLVNFLAAMIRANDWAHRPENKEAVIDIMMKETRSSREIAEQCYDYYIVRHPNALDFTDLKDAPVQNVIRLMRELEDEPPNLPAESQWIDRSFARRAAELARGQ